MRVSDQAIYGLANLRISRARQESVDAGEQVSSGKKVEHPWDAAADSGLIVHHAQESARETAIQSAAQRSSEELVMADGAWDQVTTSLTRLKELATQMANDTYSAADRAGAATEAQQLFGAIVSQANVRLGERYLFGGTTDRTPPFDATGNYSGDANVRRVEIAPGVMNDASTRADVALKGAGGGVDVFASIQNFITALSTNNGANVRVAVQSMDDSLNQITAERSRVGAMMNTFDVAATMAKQNLDAAKDARASLEDVDIFEASTRLAASQRALEASMSAAAQQFKLTLLDKL
ncbi:MAG: flagellin [Archangium sp.]